jgi:hypothetical protein
MSEPKRRAHVRLNRILRPVPVAAAVAVLLAPLALASPAHAAVTATFCPAGGGTIGLQASGSPGNTDRCAGAFHSSVNWVEANNTATSVMKCAVLKPNPDGSGGNVGGLAAVCQPGTTTAVQTVSPPRGGYSTIINQGANFHNGFWGRVQYN